MKGLGEEALRRIDKIEQRGERFIYFVLAKQTNLVKIGRTLQPCRRFAALESSNADRLEVVLLIMEGDKHEEQRLHDEFSDLRHHFEWFKYEDPIIRFVNEINSTADAINEDSTDE